MAEKTARRFQSREANGALHAQSENQQTMRRLANCDARRNRPAPSCHPREVVTGPRAAEGRSRKGNGADERTIQRPRGNRNSPSKRTRMPRCPFERRVLRASRPTRSRFVRGAPGDSRAATGTTPRASRPRPPKVRDDRSRAGRTPASRSPSREFQRPVVQSRAPCAARHHRPIQCAQSLPQSPAR